MRELNSLYASECQPCMGYKFHQYTSEIKLIFFYEKKRLPTFLHSENSRILYKTPKYNFVSFLLFLHHLVYTAKKYAYQPLQPPIMTCITSKGGS